MSKRKKAQKRFAGVDVSKDVLDVCAAREEGPEELVQFENTATGHKKLVKWLLKEKGGARVALEATGTYSFDVAVALHQAGIETMVVNPRAAYYFSEALMQRTHTDQTAAQGLREFVLRMEFQPWTPPSTETRQLREIARRIAALSKEGAAEKNRLHALEACADHSRVVASDLRVNLQHLRRRIAQMLKEARRLIDADAMLACRHTQLRTLKGIGLRSAVSLLGELLTLPADMTARQWVSHAGLNPRLKTSGTSVHKTPRISKQGNARLRGALYMPALVARRFNQNVRAYADRLQSRGKTPLQVIVAVMRKLLHSIHGMFSSNSNFIGEKFYRTTPALTLPAATS